MRDILGNTKGRTQSQKDYGRDAGTYVPMLERRGPFTIARARYGWDSGRLAQSQEIGALSRPTVYQLFTEDRWTLGAIVARYFDAFSIIPVVGYFRGTEECGAVVQLVGRAQDSDKVHVRTLAQAIADEHEQLEVLVLVQLAQGGHYSYTVKGGR